MSEKQFDHIENRIREAAENSEPDYDEHAWGLMEARLNKEDNRKPVFLLWVFALLLLCITAGGVYWWIGNGNKEFIEKNEQQVTANPMPDQRSSKNVSKVPDSSLIATGLSKSGQDQLNNSGAIAAGKQPLLSHHTANNASQLSKPKKGLRVAQKGKLSTKTIVPKMDTDNELVNITEPETLDPVEIEERIDNRKIASDIKRDSLQMVDSKIVKANNDSTVSKSGEKNSRKASRFYLLAVLGADAGSVKLLSFKNNEITPKYGIGIGYQINKRLSVQTGFYASWKKYIAGPRDYNYKAGSYWTTVKMIKVDAACLVYDIPLTIRYDFIQKPSTNYFVTAGLSSFIMKQEDYNYHYTRNGMYYQAQKSYTGNKSFLSVFNLSAGVEKSVTSVFALLVEPSIAIPLAGIGDGSVKLYSTALQVGIKYKPSKRKK